MRLSQNSNTLYVYEKSMEYSDTLDRLGDPKQYNDEQSAFLSNLEESYNISAGIINDKSSRREASTGKKKSPSYYDKIQLFGKEICTSRMVDDEKSRSYASERNSNQSMEARHTSENSYTWSQRHRTVANESSSGSDGKKSNMSSGSDIKGKKAVLAVSELFCDNVEFIGEGLQAFIDVFKSSLAVQYVSKLEGQASAKKKFKRRPRYEEEDIIIRNSTLDDEDEDEDEGDYYDEEEESRDERESTMTDSFIVMLNSTLKDDEDDYFREEEEHRHEHESTITDIRRFQC